MFQLNVLVINHQGESIALFVSKALVAKQQTTNYTYDITHHHNHGHTSTCAAGEGEGGPYDGVCGVRMVEREVVREGREILQTRAYVCAPEAVVTVWIYVAALIRFQPI